MTPPNPSRVLAPPAESPRGPALSSLLAAAARGLQNVSSGRSGAVALAGTPPAVRPGAQALLFHVLRHLGLAQALRKRLAPRTPPPAVDALLCTALALAAAPGDMPYDPFTLVNQAVNAAKDDVAMRAQAGFLNACLRRFLREQAALLEAVQSDPLAQWNHPAWWIKRMQREWPNDWQSVLQANNAQAPMVLRINKQKTALALYQQALDAINMEAYEQPHGALVLARAVAVHELPGFADGVVSVQDASAQRAAPLLLEGLLGARGAGAQPLRVLDACAAPGGKTAHLLEYAGDAPIEVTALEVDAERARRILETLERIGLAAQVLVQDAARPQDWWQQHCGGVPFDAILLDAPCTASGIVRRHPDVRWLRRETDIAQLARQQAQLLDALWPLLQEGGRLLYCTCSVFHAEGADQVQTFLGRNNNARLLPSPGHILPAAGDRAGHVPDNRFGGHDGFYYALLQKIPA